MSQENDPNLFRLKYSTLFFIEVCREAKERCHYIVDKYENCWLADGQNEYPGTGESMQTFCATYRIVVCQCSSFVVLLLYLFCTL